MRWILRRWFLAGGMRSFLAGYIGCPLLIGLVAAIVAGIEKQPAAGLLVVPGALLAVPMACVLAPVGLIMGMVSGIESGWPGWPGWWGWGPWDGRLVFMGLVAGLVVLVIVGRWLEKRNRAADGGDDTPRVPTARAVTPYLFPTSTWNRLIGRLATVPWKQLIGPSLLVIAGAGFLCLGCIALAVWGAGA
jgi:hypothetical protein